MSKPDSTKPVCSVEDCDREVHSRGWCSTHYTRWHTTGDLSRGRKRIPWELRFWSKVRKTETCWLWIGNTRNGYGRFRLGSDTPSRAAHRIAYELLIGNIPKGLDLDHLCRVRNCVNPEHLEPVTRSLNIRRGEGPLLLSQRQTRKEMVCKNGHPLVGKNIYYRPDRPGKVECRQCRLDAVERHKTRKRRRR